jgi:hypothetical protein
LRLFVEGLAVPPQEVALALKSEVPSNLFNSLKAKSFSFCWLSQQAADSV